jgi:hypothetical protein
MNAVPRFGPLLEAGSACDAHAQVSVGNNAPARAACGSGASGTPGRIDAARPFGSLGGGCERLTPAGALILLGPLPPRASPAREP